MIGFIYFFYNLCSGSIDSVQVIPSWGFKVFVNAEVERVAKIFVRIVALKFAE